MRLAQSQSVYVHMPERSSLTRQQRFQSKCLLCMLHLHRASGKPISHQTGENPVKKTLVKGNLTSLLLLLTVLCYSSENIIREYSNFMAPHEYNGGCNRNPLQKNSCQQPVLVNTHLWFHSGTTYRKVLFKQKVAQKTPKLLAMGKKRALQPGILSPFFKNTISEKPLLEKANFQIYLKKGQMLKKLHIWPGLHITPFPPPSPNMTEAL